MLKRAQMFCSSGNPACEQIRTFLEENGVAVTVRDVTAKPLTKREWNQILGHHDLKHYLDLVSPSYKKFRLDRFVPPREELLGLIAEHPDLVRQPIILSGRLMTIGSGRKQLIDMFQIVISDNGSGNGRPEEFGNRV